ncbi:MAG TPA: SDR family oxidoreductase [Sphingomonas sp.]|nr:SDR family oxidoreductase [Sphingomonas sp.]
MRILVLGITGMLGSTAFRLLSARGDAEVFGLARSESALRWFPGISADRILAGIDAASPDRLADAIAQVRPDVVINAIGIIKQIDAALDPLTTIPINAELPHRLALLCALSGARLIHVSTDCVFSGRTGGYREDDPPDATDLYGLSKYLGEVDQPHALTLRTSIIGPELATRHGLLEWFLSQRGSVRGYAGTVFSGLTSAELTRAIAEYAIPHPELHGLYHVAAAPIAKHDLVRMIRSEYRHPVAIERVAEPTIDRSLDGDRFRAATGYVAPAWPEMIRQMHFLDERAVRRMEKAS